MCTVLLPLGVYPIAVKYISYHITCKQTNFIVILIFCYAQINILQMTSQVLVQTTWYVHLRNDFLIKKTLVSQKPVVHRTNIWLLWDWYYKDTPNRLIFRDWEQSKLDLQKLPPSALRTTNLTKLYMGYLLWNSTITGVSTLLSNNLIALISSKAPRRGPTCCKWKHQNVPKAMTFKILSHSSYMIFPASAQLLYAFLKQSFAKL